MKVMSSFSIHQRHLMIIGVILTGFFLTGAIALLSNSKIQSLSETQLKLESLKQSLLSIRHHEKDFIRYKDYQYLELLQSEQQNAVALTEELHASLNGMSMANNNIAAIADKLEQYNATFLDIFRQQEAIGLDHQSGLYGNLRNAIHAVESKITGEPQLMAQMLMLRRHEKDFMLRRDKTYIEKFSGGIRQMHSLLELRPGIDLTAQVNQYEKQFLKLYEAEVTLGLTHDQGMTGKLRNEANELEGLVAEQAQLLEKFITDQANNQIAMFMLLLTLLAIFSLAAVYSISAGVSHGLYQLIRHVVSLIKDDSFKKNRRKTHNELEILEDAFNALNNNLGQAIREIKNSADNITEVTDEIVTATENVTRSSSDQYCKIEQSAAAMEQMTLSIHEVAKNAHNTSEFVGNINDRLCDATSISATAQEAIESLKEELTKSVSVIGKLQDSSSVIDELLDSIQSIADQTNLLALNAAIEAARAGEYGRGFTVVADEVRTLSSKTSAATGEVRKTLDEFKNVITTVVDTVNASSKKGSDSQNHANNAIQLMREMTQKVAEISMMNLQIASSVEEQSTAAEGLNEHIHSIFESSKTVRDANDHTNEATQRLSEVAEKINESASVFAV